jgi:hypothetical protein
LSFRPDPQVQQPVSITSPGTSVTSVLADPSSSPFQPAIAGVYLKPNRPRSYAHSVGKYGAMVSRYDGDTKARAVSVSTATTMQQVGGDEGDLGSAVDERGDPAQVGAPGLGRRR